MSKTTQYDRIEGLEFRIKFNISNPTLSGSNIHPVRITAVATAITEDDAKRTVSKALHLGDPVEKPLTNKQIYTKVKNFNSQLGALIKDLVLEALDEDVSA